MSFENPGLVKQKRMPHHVSSVVSLQNSNAFRIL